MKRSLLLAIVMMAATFLVGASAQALSFNHNVYHVSGGADIMWASGPAEVTFGEDGNFSGAGSWAGLDWDIVGQQTGSAVSYNVTTPAIPDLVVSQVGTVGDFGFGGYYLIPGILEGGADLYYGVGMFSSPGATGWIGDWNLNVQTLSGPYSGTVRITSAADGVFEGIYLSWPDGTTPSFSGTYSPDGSFTLTVPDQSNCTFYGAYGNGWHGTFTGPQAVGYFIDNNMVPEPSALIALLTGLAGAAGFIRRKF